MPRQKEGFQCFIISLNIAESRWPVMEALPKFMIPNFSKTLEVTCFVYKHGKSLCWGGRKIHLYSLDLLSYNHFRRIEEGTVIFAGEGPLC